MVPHRYLLNKIRRVTIIQQVLEERHFLMSLMRKKSTDSWLGSYSMWSLHVLLIHRLQFPPTSQRRAHEVNVTPTLSHSE